MSFSKIAHVYDHFNALEIYERWLDFTLSARDTQPDKVLDAACGTGWFTQLLAPFCGEILGFDLDEQMIKVAQSQPGNSENSRYCVADMLDLAAFETDYDLVTCYADSFCFLPDDVAVAQAFGQLAQRLKPGGSLLFDVWTPAQIQAFDGFSYFDSDAQYALLWDSEAEMDRLSVAHYLTVFERQPDTALFQREDVVLTERTYPLEWYQQALRAAGFRSVEVLVDFGSAYYAPDQHATTAERWFFRCVK